MRKLRAIVFEDDIDAVTRSLGEVGIAQIIDLHEKMGEWHGVLTPYTVSAEITARCTEMLSKIRDSFEVLDIRPEQLPATDLPALRGSTKEILTNAEKKLEELPIETLRRCSKIISRIDQLISTFEIRSEITAEIPLRGPVAESLSEIEKELAEIEKEYATIGLMDRKLLFDRLKTLPVDEKSELGKKLIELKRFVVTKQTAFGKELSALRKAVETVKQMIEAETKIGEIRGDLLTLQRTIEREKQITQIEEKLARTAKTVYFEAWVPEDHVREAIEIVNKATDGNGIVTDEPPAKDEKAPIVLKQASRFVTAFERLVFAFGYPSNGDVNPVNILAITFPILFGIMFADVGQGALFVALGTLLTVAKRRVRLRKVGDIQQYLLVSSEMFMLLGISAMFFGFVFGEFFGPSGVIHPISLGRIGPFYLGGFEPIHEPMNMLRFAIFVGVIHIGLGLILRFLNEIRHRRYRLAPVPVCWLWLLLGGLFMWAYWGGLSSISKWFAEGLPMLAGLVMLPLMLIMVFTSLAEGFMEGVGFSVEVFAETLSHTMSYSRLMALGLIHSAMNHLFLVLGGVQHGHFPLASIPMIAVGTVLVMIIEGLVVFVHTLRLHWVEWFSKFYTGEGIAFKPFKLT